MINDKRRQEIKDNLSKNISYVNELSDEELSDKDIAYYAIQIEPASIAFFDESITKDDSLQAMALIGAQDPRLAEIINDYITLFLKNSTTRE